MEPIRYGVGLDVSMAKFDACLCAIDVEGRVVVRATTHFKNDPSGFTQFTQWVQKHLKGRAAVSYVMEATGVYYEGLAWHLHEQNCRVSVVLPNKAKKYKQALGLRTKTDKVDARALAQMAAEQALAQWRPLSKAFYELRPLTRHIEALSGSITRVKNQGHAQGFAHFENRGVVTALKEQLKLLEKQKQLFTKQVVGVIHSDEQLQAKCARILKIKGLGINSLAVVLGETGGFALFESIAQLVSYAGYDVVEDQSGKHKGPTKISKQGNGHIRRILHMPALNVVGYEQPPFASLYERIYQRSKVKMKAYTAVQKKLLILIYTLWKKDGAYDPAYRNLLTSKDAEAAPSFALAE
jgi:transposase